MIDEHFHRIERGDNRAAVCFIHGLFGHYQKTWGDFPCLFTEDNDLSHCDVICWGYPSNLRQIYRGPLGFRFIGRKPPDLKSVAEALHSDLANPAIGGGYSYLVLVGHSMGGLIIKQMIISVLKSSSMDRSVLDRVRHVLLYGTPSEGVELSSIFKIHPHTKEIACNGPLVEKLKNEWINRVHNVRPDDPPNPTKLHVPVTVVVGSEDNAVSKQKAASFHENVQTVQGSHTEIAKPKNRNQTSFQVLKGAVLSCTNPNVGDFRSIKQILETRNDTVKSVGTRIIGLYEKGVSPISSGFSMEIEDWVLRANREFWDVHTQVQRSRAAGKNPLVVRVTHSTAIDIWETPDSDQSLYYQKSFIESGGRIERIFIGTEANPNERYLRVMNRMYELGIQVFYVDYHKIGVFDLLYDFTWVEELNLVTKWYSHVGQSVRYYELSEEATEHVAGQWKLIWQTAKDNPWIKLENRKRPYEGNYWGYHYSTSRSGELMVSSWQVMQVILGQLTVHVSDDSLEYEGEMYVEEGNIYFLLRGVGHREEWHVVCDVPFNPEAELRGVYSGLGATDRKPFAGKILLTRNEISESNAKQLLGEDIYITY